MTSVPSQTVCTTDHSVDARYHASAASIAGGLPMTEGQPLELYRGSTHVALIWINALRRNPVYVHPECDKADPFFEFRSG